MHGSSVMKSDKILQIDSISWTHADGFNAALDSYEVFITMAIEVGKVTITTREIIVVHERPRKARKFL